MTNAEHHEYMCSILSKLVDSDLTSTELADLSSAVGIKVEDFYYPKPLDVIEWERKAA